MTFSRILCWQPERARTVLNTDAEDIDPSVFLAVHTPYDLVLADTDPNIRLWGQRKRWRTRPEAVLQGLIDPSRHHVQLAVVGGSGSGKSHFIRWLELNMPDRDDLYVLTIPKTGTTLRGVLDRIIDVLPPSRQTAYRDNLNKAGYYSEESRTLRRNSMLDAIAQAIGADHVRPDSALAPDEEAWLLEGLPKLFRDVHLRRYLDQDTGVVDDLVTHITESSRTYERVEERRAFRPEDLLLSSVDVGKMAAETREFASHLIGLPDSWPHAVEIVNRNLNGAVARVLNFSGDQLIDLMQDIRRSLRAQGKGLVLLIEDFARFEGMDYALLQALTQAAGTGPEALCELRWAMAVTGGRYEHMANSVQTRMDFLVDMDLPTRGQDAVLTDDSIISFSAHYLNAARVQGEPLRRWFTEERPIESDAPVPNACAPCPYRPECHEAFGAVDEVGLYPFTRRGLLNMAERQDPDIAERFNPRRLIKFVLAPVLGEYGQDIPRGLFPNDSLLEEMGRSRLSPALQDQLRRADPDNFSRQHTVLELWGQPGKPIRLRPGLYTAFDLPAPQLQNLGNAEEVTDVPPRDPRPSPETTGDRHIRAIQAWGRGEVMPQDTANELRDPIFTAVAGAIDWDMAGLERAAFAQRNARAFRARNITFQRQATQEPVANVILRIPAKRGDRDGLLQAAIALEALYRFQQNRDWAFPNGQQMLVALAESLDLWSADVLGQLQRLPDDHQRWDPVGAAVEVLAAGALLAGKLAPTGTPLTADYLNVLFETWPEQAPVQTKDWGDLYAAIRASRGELKALIQSHAGGGKGGAKSSMLDPARVLPPLRRFRRNWTLTVTPPEGAGRGEYEKLVRLHEQVRTGLLRVGRAERERRLSWLQQVRTSIAAGEGRLEVAEALKDVRAAVVDDGVEVGRQTLERFAEQFEIFRQVQLDAAIQAAERVAEVSEPAEALRLLARDHLNATQSAETFLPIADRLLAEAEATIARRRAELMESIAEDLPRDQQRIRDSLSQLTALLSPSTETH